MYIRAVVREDDGHICEVEGMHRSTVFFVGHDGFSPARMQMYMYAQVYDCISGYNMSEATTIRIRTETRDDLRRFGRKDETYDELIRRLLEAARKLSFFEELDRIVETEEFVPLDEV